MGFYPTDDNLEELLQSCGLKDLRDEISFELFARTMALLLEENNQFVRQQIAGQNQYDEGEEEQEDY